MASPSIRVRLAALLIRIAVRLAYVVGTIFRRPYLRFVGLQDAARRDIARRRYTQAEAKAAELIALAEQFPHDWDYGNAIRHGHLILGRVALVRGDVGRACRELIAAGHTPGSPSSIPSARIVGLRSSSSRSGRSLRFLSSFSFVRRFGIRDPVGPLLGSTRCARAPRPISGPT